MDSLTAKANVGAGTDALAGVQTPAGFAGAVALVDDAGALVSGANRLPVSVASLPLPTGGATEATLAALAATADTLLKPGNAVQVSNFPATQPVSLASAPLPSGAATDATLSSLNAKFSTSTSIPDNQAAGITVRPVGQDTWVASFSAVGASIIDSQFRTPDVGTGVGYSQAAGALVITSGTTANSEFLTRSLTAWRSTMQLRYSAVLSQRIVNNNFAVILADLTGENLACTINSATSITVTKVAHGFTAQNVGQFMFVGGISGAAGVPGRYAIASVPTADTITFTVAGWPASGSCTVDLFGHSHVKHLYNGITATSMIVDAQRRGWASGDTAITVNTSAAPGHIMQAHLAGREIYWADTLRASSTLPNMTSRGSRFENLPDDNLDLYLFLWSYNGTVAPATTTTWTVAFAAVEKFANTPVYIQGQEMQGNVAPAPVATVGTVSVAGTVTATVGTSITGGTISPLTVAGVSVEVSAARTVTATGTTITNASARGASFFVNISAVSGTAPTLVVRLQVQDPVSLLWVDVPGAVTGTLSAISTIMLTVYPGVTPVANGAVSFALPRVFRFAWVIGGTTPSFTFSIGAAYQL